MTEHPTTAQDAAAAPATIAACRALEELYGSLASETQLADNINDNSQAILIWPR